MRFAMAIAELESLHVDEKLPAEARKEPEVNKLFRAVMKHEGSDLHLKSGLPPMMRHRGLIKKMDLPALSQDNMERLLTPIMGEKHLKVFDETGGCDFAWVIGNDECRFRVNVLRQRGKWSLVARRVSNKIPTFEGLHLPPSIEKLCHYDQGMIILAGVTGSGKSTTIASMLDYINEREAVHILTIEDPIEYVFTDKKAVVNQREVYIDVKDWNIALKHAVREDPDIILVGEMRDLETIELAITAASTGHLVFGTLHTQSAAKTVDRIIDVFPSDQQNKIRATLSESLRGVVAQNLFKRVDKKGRVAALEILVFTTAVANLVREGKTHQIPGMIQVGKKLGNQPLDDAIMEHLRMKRVSPEEAYDKCLDKKKFRPFLPTPPIDDDV
jgi:twitching motility protein PilT